MLVFSSMQRMSWTIELKQRVHRLRREGKYPDEIALLIGSTESAVNRILSLEKQRGIKHDKLKPRHLKYDKETVAKWREMRKGGMTYPQMSAILNVHPVAICIRLGRESQGLLRF